VDEDGHQEGGGLGVGGGIVRGFACDQSADEGLNLFVGEGEAIALVLDYVDRVNGHLNLDSCNALSCCQ
jgi:hypothetical protein